MYDSRIETFQHRHTLQELVWRAIKKLWRRALDHDLTKLDSPEREVYDRFPERAPYGTDAYRLRLLEMTAALQHHYAHPLNRHHPEHFPNGGCANFTLLDYLECVLDWWATSLKQPGGDIRASIEANQRRFGFSDDIKNMLLQTLKELEAEGEK